MSEHMPFVYDDGGRIASGRKGRTGDCVCRAIAIASQRPYGEVYDELADHNAKERNSKTGRTARRGIHTSRQWFKEYMRANGFEWTSCMSIGSGCKVHLVAGELPMGRLVVSVSRHLVAVIDGVIHDTGNPQRRTHWYENGIVNRVSERCVYGYWKRI